MLLKITTRSCDCGERIQLEGHLTGPYLPELERAMAAARERDPRIALELSELVFLDGEAARFVRDLADRKIPIHGCSAFVAELLGLRAEGALTRRKEGPCYR